MSNLKKKLKYILLYCITIFIIFPGIPCFVDFNIDSFYFENWTHDGRILYVMMVFFTSVIFGAIYNVIDKNKDDRNE